MIQEATDRIRQMELYFDMLLKTESENPEALREDVSIKEILQTLTQYYENGQWLREVYPRGSTSLPQAAHINPLSFLVKRLLSIVYLSLRLSLSH